MLVPCLRDAVRQGIQSRAQKKSGRNRAESEVSSALVFHSILRSVSRSNLIERIERRRLFLFFISATLIIGVPQSLSFSFSFSFSEVLVLLIAPNINMVLIDGYEQN